MQKHLQKFFLLLSVAFATTASAQNEVYWREGFEPSATPACDLGTVAPTTNGTFYFNGNAGSWYGMGVYRTTGPTGSCPAGASNNHVRYKNMSSTGVTDSGYMITPVVDFGIKEFHFYRGRTSRITSFYVTSDTSATTTNWTYVTSSPKSASTSTCSDTIIMINSVTAKRLKIVSAPGTDSDYDSIGITSVNHITPVKFGAISVAEANGLIKLNWNVETESNINNYTIERATSNGDFVAISALNATNSKSYSFIDKSATAGTFNYRVKAIGNDGNVFYSNVVKVVVGKSNAAEMSIYPNPVKGGNISVQLTGISRGSYKINFYATTGVLVHTTTVNCEGTSVAKTLDVAGILKAGTYTIEVTNGSVRTVKSIIVQ